MNRSTIFAAVIGGVLLIPQVGTAARSILGMFAPSAVVVAPVAPELAPTAPTPSAESQAVVAPITAALAGKKDQAKEMALFFAQAAEVFSKAPYVKYSTQFAEATRLAQEATYGRTLADDAVRPLLVAALKPVMGEPGAESIELDAAGRQRIIDRYSAISWAAYQAYRGAR